MGGGIRFVWVHGRFWSEGVHMKIGMQVPNLMGSPKFYDDVRFLSVTATYVVYKDRDKQTSNLHA